MDEIKLQGLITLNKQRTGENPEQTDVPAEFCPVINKNSSLILLCVGSDLRQTDFSVQIITNCS